MKIAAACRGGEAGLATSATTPGMDKVQAPASRLELPQTLLAGGYHLRQINAMRARFDGQAERMVLSLLLWVAGRLTDPDPEVANAAAAVLASLGLETRPIPRRYSLRKIADATGFPRETLRRTARQIEAGGWIMPDTEGHLGVTRRFTDFLWADGASERLQDFRWTAARVRELTNSATAPICACVTEALAAMRACHGDELPRSIHRKVPATLTGARRATALVYMCGYNVRHLVRIAPYFNGDLLQVSLLGALARRNIAALTPGAVKPGEDLATVLKLNQPAKTLMTNPQRAFNAYSLAAYLGIPYETTRGKLSQLCSHGWVARDAGRLYWVLPRTVDDFRQFYLERRADMLATAAAIDALLQSSAPAASSTERTHSGES